jgi:hypothetical protein
MMLYLQEFVYLRIPVPPPSVEIDKFIKMV